MPRNWRLSFVVDLACSLASRVSARPRALLAITLPVVVLAGPLAADAAARSPHLTAARPPARGPLNSVQRQVLRQGYLVPNQAAYDRAKARAARRAGSLSAHAAAFAPRVPTASPSFNGLRDKNVGPPDTTGAVGTTRFIETINDKFAIYSKTSTTPISTGSLSALWNSGGAITTDPQVIWDPGTRRFYYAGLILVSGSDNELTFGFSKTASPNSATDFCHYFITYGRELPDYPKLGDTRDFVVFGTNTFSNSSATGTYVGSDILGVTKPSSGTTCPAASTFKLSSKLGVQNQGGSTLAFTPEPANQTDTAGAGYVVASHGMGGSSGLTLFKITKAADGSANIPQAGSNLSVPNFSPPPNAPQAGTARVLDTLDGRLTQAVSAIDPARGASGKVALWTQHTVAGGAGSEVRWYEIDPAAKALFQSGKATSASLYYFNGGISPNRVVNGATKAFGSDMAMSFNRSSSSVHPSIAMVSKIGGGAQSAPVVVKSSPSSLSDFTCTPAPCRWGDYAGATPDPAPPSGTSRVWAVNEWVVEPGSLSGSGWGTWNFAITP
jgi:hypothetical protein